MGFGVVCTDAGLVVVNVDPESPAGLALQVGDVIVRVNGVEPAGSSTGQRFLRLLDHIQKASKVVMTVQRSTPAPRVDES